MNQNKYTDLIVGGDSAIGARLFETLEKSGRKPCKSSRRQQNQRTENVFFLDLSTEKFSTIPAVNGASYLVAGITSIAECEQDRDKAYLVNVENTTKLAQHLSGKVHTIVYLSSTAVFDGTDEFCSVDSKKNPTTEYGRQKDKCESILLDTIEDLVILRLGKVLSRGDGLIEDWISSLERGETIKAFRDKFVSPISLPKASDLIARLGTSNHRGIFHFTAIDEVSYFEIATYIREKLSLPESMVVAQNCGIGSHATLDCKDTSEKLAIEIPSSWDAIDYMISKRCVTT